MEQRIVQWLREYPDLSAAQRTGQSDYGGRGSFGVRVPSIL